MSEYRDGKLCPVCRRDIGMWAVLRAPLPDMIRCPHCSQRLRYGDTQAVVAIELIAFAVAAAACVILAAIIPVHDFMLRIVAFVVSYFVAMEAIELITTTFLRGNKALQVLDAATDTVHPRAGWYPDPTGRFGRRYWDGAVWTEHVESQGRVTQDPL